MNKVTFIIPTMGRNSLSRTVQSLIDQNISDWEALVVFDGRFEVNYISPDSRVSVLKSDVNGHAGLIRNYGIDRVNTDWMAFLDDDDWVEKSYVHNLRDYSNNRPELDLVIFSYKDITNGRIIPPQGTKEFESCLVGISFAARTSFIKDNNIRFTSHSVEDFRFLDDCRNAGARYQITNDIQYYVGGIGGWLRKD